MQAAVARKLAYRLTRVVAQLHDHNISYGDLSASNILFSTTTFDAFSLEKIYEVFGKPEEFEMKTVQDVDEHKPEFFYGPVDSKRLEAGLIRYDITLVDMGEAVVVDETPRESSFGFNENYTAPEFHFGGQRSKASDVWALACCFFELRAGKKLFPAGSSGFFGHVCQMTETLGLLPMRWIEEIERQAPDFRRDVESHSRSPAKGDEDCSLKAQIEGIGHWPMWCYWTAEERREKMVERWRQMHIEMTEEELQHEIHRGPNPPGPLCNEETTDLVDLLTKMLRYEPAERITIQEVLEHSWLNKSYTDVVEWSGPWRQTYDMGILDAQWTDDTR